MLVKMQVNKTKLRELFTETEQKDIVDKLTILIAQTNMGMRKNYPNIENIEWELEFVAEEDIKQIKEE